MVVKDFQKLLAKRPFKPFRLVMSRGETYEVRHPEMALLTRSNIMVGVEVEDGVPASFEFCLLLHVASIEMIKQPSAA